MGYAHAHLISVRGLLPNLNMQFIYWSSVLRVKIGPYKNYWGVYQLTNLMHRVGVSQALCDRWGERLGETRVNDFFQWLYTKRKRNIEVKIDKYDTWGMDTTLAHIILPMLKQLNATKHGAPFVDDEDVPEHLRSTAAEPKVVEWDIDSNHFARWDWVMHEMIWAFEQLVYDGEARWYSRDFDWDPPSVDEAGMAAWDTRKKNGFRLFGKYYEGLWD